jgi:hypothetical protein
MSEFTETVAVSGQEQSVKLSVTRIYKNGVIYTSTLSVALSDAPTLAKGLESFAKGESADALHLSDSTINALPVDKSALVNLEIKRAKDHPQGSYDTLSVSREGAQTLVEGIGSSTALFGESGG